MEKVSNTIKPISVKDLFDKYIAFLKENGRTEYALSVKQVCNSLLKYNKEGNYLFPVFSYFHQTEQQQINRTHKVTSKVNTILKSIGKELTIPIKLTTYVARHNQYSSPL